MSTPDIPRRRAIAEELLNGPIDEHGCARCPGFHLHSTRNAARDFRLWIDENVPNAKCVHDSCTNIVADFLHEWRSRVARAERVGQGTPRPPSLMGAVSPQPMPPRPPKRPPFKPDALVRVAAQVPAHYTADFIAARSPVSLPSPEAQGAETARLFLDTLYFAGERILVFLNQTSQGDFMHEAGQGSFRLARERGVEPLPSAPPSGGSEGVWYLTNPVSGEWRMKTQGRAAWSRRTGDCITAWRYCLLESDVAEPALWLRALCALPLRIAAIYTSGGRSVHALVRLDASCKLEWDVMRDVLLQRLCPLGADGAAMSAVRLSRLAGCRRGGKRDKDGRLIRYETPTLQRLLWLDANPPPTPLVDRVK